MPNGGVTVKTPVTKHTPAIEAEIRRSSEVLRWQPDWDDDGAQQISLQSWLKAVDFLRGYDGPTPRITPNPEGVVDMFWQTDNRELLITFWADETPSYYGDDRHGQDQHKGTITSDDDRRNLLAWVALGWVAD